MGEDRGRDRYLADRAADLAIRVARLTRDLAIANHRLHEVEAELAEARQTIAEMGSHLGAAIVVAGEAR